MRHQIEAASHVLDRRVTEALGQPREKAATGLLEIAPCVRRVERGQPAPQQLLVSLRACGLGGRHHARLDGNDGAHWGPFLMAFA